MHLGLPKVGKPLNFVTLYINMFSLKTKIHAIGNQVGDSYQDIDIFNDHGIPKEGASSSQTRKPPITFGEWGSDDPTFAGLTKLLGLLDELETCGAAMLSFDR